MKLKKNLNLSLDKFINLSLYDKKNGYYMKNNPLGKNADYITSPLVTNLFGEMLAIWCVSFWEKLGKPKKILLVELGPGDATLCSDLLKTFKTFTNFYNCLEIKLFEKSEILKKIQKNKIRNKKVKWIKKIDDLKSGPIIFITNEFFDALPIKQFYKNKKKFFERHVSFSKKNKKFFFTKRKAKNNLVKSLNKYGILSETNIIEYPSKGIDYIETIAKKIKKLNGGLLIIDYGYDKKNNKDTLQSVMKHKYIDIFAKPSFADITHHINYKLFREVLKKNNLLSERLVTQNEFLQRLGIVERANIISKKINFKEKIKMYYNLKKLLHHSEMGELFKVLFAHKKETKFSLGFE